jgi:mRNA-decapping enzyme subunit 2
LNFLEFSNELFKRFDFLQPYLPMVENNIEKFKDYKSLVPVCGGILVNKNRTKLLLVQGYSKSRSTWTFPKGKINKNESEEDCAIRELKEEIGYDISDKIESSKFVTFYAEKKKKIKLFVIENVPENTIFQTQTRKEIGNIAWHTIEDIQKNTSKYFYVSAFLKDVKKIIASPKKSLKNTNVILKEKQKTLSNTDVVVVLKKPKMKTFSFNTEEIF